MLESCVNMAECDKYAKKCLYYMVNVDNELAGMVVLS